MTINKLFKSTPIKYTWRAFIFLYSFNFISWIFKQHLDYICFFVWHEFMHYNHVVDYLGFMLNEFKLLWKVNLISFTSNHKFSKVWHWYPKIICFYISFSYFILLMTTLLCKKMFHAFQIVVFSIIRSNVYRWCFYTREALLSFKSLSQIFPKYT